MSDLVRLKFYKAPTRLRYLVASLVEGGSPSTLDNFSEMFIKVVIGLQLAICAFYKRQLQTIQSFSHFNCGILTFSNILTSLSTLFLTCIFGVRVPLSITKCQDPSQGHLEVKKVWEPLKKAKGKARALRAALAPASAEKRGLVASLAGAREPARPFREPLQPPKEARKGPDPSP